MVMKAYHKTVFRFIKNNFIRIVIMGSIIAICVGLTTGLGSFKDLVSKTFDNHFEKISYLDINIKNTSMNPMDFGMSINDKNIIDSIKNVVDSELLLEIDKSNYKIRLINLDFKNQLVNKIELVSGRLPENNNEVVVENRTSNFIKHEIGDKLIYENEDLSVFGLGKKEVTIVGIVENTNYAFKGKVINLADYNNEPIDDVTSIIDTVIYFDNNYLNIPLYTDLYIKLDHNYSYFSNNYDNYVLENVEEFKTLLNKDSLVFLTHDDFTLPIAIKENMNKTQVIAYIFPLFFMIVVIIVEATTLTRMIEDDRSKAATYRSLGYHRNSITIRYYVVAVIASLLGSIAGIFLGFYIFGKLIIEAFNTLIRIPEVVNGLYVDLGILTSIILFIAIMLTVIFISYGQLRLKTSELMRPKSPKPGGKVFLEYVPFIWERLKFKYKSSLRNILRYPLHFIMTVLAVLGSTALLFAGLGLYANTVLIKDDSASTVQLIGYIIIFASALLSILVTYNLTNMNIEERHREIATLKVLGYRKDEVSGYIYREVFITSLLGIILGIPAGYLLVKIVFDYIDFGTPDNINWYYYIITVVVSLIFIGVSDLLLYNKIHKINMNASLKVID